MSMTIGNCFALTTAQSHNYSKLNEDLRIEDLRIDFGDEEERMEEQEEEEEERKQLSAPRTDLLHHYESLPLSESPDEQVSLSDSRISAPEAMSRVPALHATNSGSTTAPSKTSSSSLDPSSAFHDLPDPFPELRCSHLPVSAQLYSSQLSPVWVDKVTEGSPTMQDDVFGLNSFNNYNKNVAEDKVLQTRTSVNIYVSEQMYHSVEIDGTTTASDVCRSLTALSHSKHDPYHTVVEHIKKFSLERNLEDHELIYPILTSWHSVKNQFYFRKDFSRYELYTNPNHCFPEHMVNAHLPKEDMTGLMTRSERYRNLLFKNLLANQTLPDIHGFLHVRDGKKAWKKYYCVLQHSGLYYTAKSNITDTQFMVLLCSLNNVNIYLALNAKKNFGSPTQYCFCLAPTSETNDKHQLKLFCAEDEQTRLCWTTGMRFFKYGSQIQANFRASVRPNDQLNGTESPHHRLNSFHSVKSRVAMDFSEKQGRVVSNPAEALSVAQAEGARIPTTRLFGMSTSRSMITLTTEPSPPAAENNKSKNFQESLHLTQDWFHVTVDRDEAVSLISNHSLEDGTFLVRHSQSLPGVFVISFAHNSKVKHCTINKIFSEDSVYYSLDGALTKFMDITQLIDFYRLNAGRLPTRLTNPITCLR